MQDNAKHAWHCVLMQRGSKVQTTKGRAGAGGRRQGAGAGARGRGSWCQPWAQSHTHTIDTHISLHRHTSYTHKRLHDDKCR